MAMQQLYRRIWIGVLFVALLVVLCPGCGKNTVTTDRHALEPCNPDSGWADSPGMTPAAAIGTWTVPNEWSAEMGEGGMLMGYREPTDSNAPPTESTVEQEWTPVSMGDGEDSYCYTVTYPTLSETSNTESDEASGLVGDADSASRDEVWAPAVSEEEAGLSSLTDETDSYGQTPTAPAEPEEGYMPPTDNRDDDGSNALVPGTDSEEQTPGCDAGDGPSDPVATAMDALNNDLTPEPSP